MQQQEKTTPLASSTAPTKPGCQGCGQCKCNAPTPAPQPITWERKNPDDTEGGEL